MTRIVLFSLFLLVLSAQNTTQSALEHFQGMPLKSVVINSFACGVQIEQVAEDHRKNPKSNSTAFYLCRDMEAFVKANTYPSKK